VLEKSRIANKRSCFHHPLASLPLLMCDPDLESWWGYGLETWGVTNDWLLFMKYFKEYGCYAFGGDILPTSFKWFRCLQTQKPNN